MKKKKEKKERPGANSSLSVSTVITANSCKEKSLPAGKQAVIMRLGFILCGGIVLPHRQQGEWEERRGEAERV